MEGITQEYDERPSINHLHPLLPRKLRPSVIIGIGRIFIRITLFDFSILQFLTFLSCIKIKKNFLLHLLVEQRMDCAVCGLSVDFAFWLIRFFEFFINFCDLVLKGLCKSYELLLIHLFLCFYIVSLSLVQTLLLYSLIIEKFILCVYVLHRRFVVRVLIVDLSQSS